MTKDQIQWAKNYLEIEDYSLVSEPQLIRTMPWSEVVRFDTSQGSIYLKSMTKEFSYEPCIINFLRQKGCQNLPCIIAHNPSLQCFLVKDAGIPLRSVLKENFNKQIVSLALYACAELQINCIPYVPKLLEMGALDFRLKNLPSRYQCFVLDADFLVSLRLTPSEIECLQCLQPTFQSLCENLSLLGIPETLEHGDFHDNNILIQGGTLIISDFGDTCITHPFLSLSSFLSSLERHHKLSPSHPVYQELRDGYLQQWLFCAPYNNLAKAFNINHRLRPFIWILSFLRMRPSFNQKSMSVYASHFAESLRALIYNMSQEDDHI